MLKLGREIKGNIEEMAKVVMEDKKHLANGPHDASYEDVVEMLLLMNEQSLYKKQE